MDKFKSKKTALVLSGGFIKAAAWHLGVAQALNDLGFSFVANQGPRTDLEIGTYVGSSAGSLVSTALAAGVSAKDMVKSLLGDKSSNIRPITYKDIFVVNKNLIKSSKSDFYNPLENYPFLMRTTLKPFASINGFFTTQGLRNYIEEEILCGIETFEDLSADLFICASHLDYSGKIIFGKHEYPNAKHDQTAYYRTGMKIAEAASASMSVPPFYSPCPIKHPVTDDIEYFFDGEIRETLSTHVAQDNNCETIISSWTHTPYHFSKGIGSLNNLGLPYIIIQALQLMIEKKIIASRARINESKEVLNIVDRFLKDEKIDSKKGKNLLNKLEERLHLKRNTQYIDISPDHRDEKIFFSHMFSLNADENKHVMEAGYNKTLETFKNH